MTFLRYQPWPFLKLVLKEPLVHFVIGGAVLFIGIHLYRNETSLYRIVVTQQRVSELGNKYALQFGQPPTRRTLAALVKKDIHDEILYRQGLAMNLDKDDEIVRRRVVQKMKFLMQDLNAPTPPTDEALASFYEAHADQYMTPSRATFTHIFFSADKAGARNRAMAVLNGLCGDTTRAPQRGDPFPDLYDFSAYEPVQVNRLFGHSEFSRAVFSAPVHDWVGPLRSGYGWHLLYVNERQEPHLPPLAEIRDTVRADYLDQAEKQANDAAFERIARRFTIARRDDSTNDETAGNDEQAHTDNRTAER